jgi:putative ATPase
MTLFDDATARAQRAVAPLAVRMRPRTLDEVVGQEHLKAQGTPLRRMVDNPDSGGSSVFLWGPPGTGKTTLAQVVSHATSRRFVELSAVSAGVKDVREVLEEARRQLGMNGMQTVLFIDEVHRFSKTQQDALLPAVENRLVTLIAATTENPFFSVISPLLSRSLLLTLQPLTDDDIGEVVRRALVDERGLAGKITLEPDAEQQLIRMAGGDARRALTSLEAAADAADTITLDVLATAVDRAAIRYDRDGDQHYDVASAFIKSVRGSDVDASLHYLARMIEAGEDPRFIARRLVILASEDIGLADPTALTTAVAAHQAVAFIGFPEASITLAHAVIALATAPKSNAVVVAISGAQADVRRGLVGSVPAHLRDSHYQGAVKLEHGSGYRYPHDEPAGIVEQQYAPDPVADREYYQPTDRGAEHVIGERLARIRAALRGDRPPAGD